MVPGRMMALIFDIILYMQLNLLEPMNVLKVRSVALAMFCACLSVPVAGQLRQQSFLNGKWDFRLDKGFGCNQEVDVVIRPEDIEVSTGILYLIVSLVYPFVCNPIAKIGLYF